MNEPTPPSRAAALGNLKVGGEALSGVVSQLDERPAQRPPGAASVRQRQRGLLPAEAGADLGLDAAHASHKGCWREFRRADLTSSPLSPSAERPLSSVGKGRQAVLAFPGRQAKLCRGEDPSVLQLGQPKPSCSRGEGPRT